MFSKRGPLGVPRQWDRAFLVEFASHLEDAGFRLSVKLPVDLAILLRDEIPVEERVDSELRKREISFTEFLDRERNYPAVILLAENATETIKVLFVNISKKTSFMDSTFPSGHSVPSQLYVQSPDPARVYSLYHFFRDYLREHGHSLLRLVAPGLAAMLLTAAEGVAFLATRQGFLERTWGLPAGADLALMIVLAVLQYRFFKAPTGLSTNDRQTATVFSFVQRALRGEFKDNPIANIVLGVTASIIAAIVLRIIGWP